MGLTRIPDRDRSCTTVTHVYRHPFGPVRQRHGQQRGHLRVRATPYLYVYPYGLLFARSLVASVTAWGLASSAKTPRRTNQRLPERAKMPDEIRRSARRGTPSKPRKHISGGTSPAESRFPWRGETHGIMSQGVGSARAGGRVMLPLLVTGLGSLQYADGSGHRCSL